MLLAWCRIWTHVDVPISYDDNYYTMGTSYNWESIRHLWHLTVQCGSPRSQHQQKHLELPNLFFLLVKFAKLLIHLINFGEYLLIHTWEQCLFKMEANHKWFYWRSKQSSSYSSQYYTDWCTIDIELIVMKLFLTSAFIQQNWKIKASLRFCCVQYFLFLFTF